MNKPIIINVVRVGAEYIGEWKDFSLCIKTKSRRLFEVKCREALKIKGNHNVYFNYEEEI